MLIIYPLVNIQKAIENGDLQIFIVDFPMKNGGSFHSYVRLPEGIDSYRLTIHTIHKSIHPKSQVRLGGGRHDLAGRVRGLGQQLMGISWDIYTQLYTYLHIIYIYTYVCIYLFVFIYLTNLIQLDICVYIYIYTYIFIYAIGLLYDIQPATRMAVFYRI